MVLKGTAWLQSIDHIKCVTSEHHRTDINWSLGCKLLNTSSSGTHLLQFKAVVGPEVVSDVELTIRGEPNISAMKLFFLVPILFEAGPLL